MRISGSAPSSPLPTDNLWGNGEFRLSRRGLLSREGVLAALWGVAAAAAPRRAAAQAVDLGSWTTRWLVDRLTFGVTEAELTLANSLGYEGYLEYQLNYTAIDDSELNARLANYTTLGMNPAALYPLPGGQVVNELTEATILRAVFSRRQLFERMCEFWTDHFNIDINNGDDRYLKTVDDREVIRRHALGRFPDLLAASAHSPAMLYYLDNNVSVVGNPNENYARELMELHTLGVDGGYTQQDVEEVARCFTGWGLYGRGAGANAGLFRFNAGQHDNGPKTVLGVPIPAGGGINDGLTVLNLLANHPNTARFIATKLCRRFWGYEPPAGLVDAVAGAYTRTGGDIPSMLRAIFLGAQQIPDRSRYKRPYHHFVSALRAVRATITNTNGIRQQLLSAGQHPYFWGPPDGYPDNLDFWVGLILPRWNFGAALMNNQVAGVSVSENLILQDANTADGVAQRINQALFGGDMPAAEQNRIRDYLLPNPPTTTRKREAIGLAIASPTFQWH